MKSVFSVRTVDELSEVAQDIIERSKAFPLILLIGEMGVGKTTLVTKIMAFLGEEETSSPTFSLVNRYDTDSGPWFHFDLYRIQEPEELLGIGFPEYLDSSNPCLIEWPQIAAELIHPPYLQIHLALEDDSRRIEIIEVPE